MPNLVDYERAWLALKIEIAKKPSHGKRDLLAAMGEIEVQSVLQDRPAEVHEHPTLRDAATG